MHSQSPTNRVLPAVGVLTVGAALLLLSPVAVGKLQFVLQVVYIGGVILACAEALRLFRNARRLEQEIERLRQAKALDEAASSAKDQFLAHMSHEIRTPMTSILGFADVLMEPDHSCAERREALQTIRRNASHLFELINNVLDLSKIQAGQMSVERLSCDLPELVQAAISLTRQALHDKKLSFRVVTDDPIPQQIRTDPLRLRQILVNLIANAARFTERGGVELRISCRRTGSDGNNATMRFAVTDTGIGMTSEQVARLFHPFAQADESTARRFGGTGLGLAISKSLAGLLGGDIIVTSKLNSGSTFTVEIDGGCIAGAVMIDALPDDQLASPSDAESQRSSPLRGRVLLVEDGTDNQRLISLRLRHAGVSVAVAENGQVALEHLASQNFDLVLMDLQMPTMDGYTAMARLRENGCTVPVVALTARAGSAEREKCLAAGFEDYLTKPIDKPKLWACLSKYLPATSGAIDRPIISTLAEDQEVKDLLREFVKLLPGKVSELEDLLRRREPEPLRKFVHQINGAAGGYGFPDITECAADLEGLILEGAPWNSVAAATTSLAELIRRVDGYDEQSRVEERPAA